MNITDIFIRRPVLATVVSLMILVLGLRSLGSLPVRDFPYTENAVVTVSTIYTGADPALIAGFITTPLENAISQVNGIDYLTSSSVLSLSTIQAYLKLNYNYDKAMTEISAQVSSVINQLPREALPPSLSVQVGQTIDSMYIGFHSKILPSNKVTDYLIRVVQPKLQGVDGVQKAEILGGKEFAMRAWLDPKRLAAYNLTANDVANALNANDFISAAGHTWGSSTVINLTAETGLHTVEEFKQLIVKAENGSIVRLGDLAKVELGANSYDTSVSFNGDNAVYVGIQQAPTANLLHVIDGIRKVFPGIKAEMPLGLEGRIAYDAGKYINSSIYEVIKSLIEALFIVTMVIFVFLGSIRSVIIPLVTIPLSLIGAFFVMLILGYSINLLTLLALVLAIGLVVDDAIIVVENIYRHMEQGMSRLEAAYLGARELANPILAITVVLVAVYVPIGFMGGLTGSLFTEFAYSLAGAVTISAINALTLSPMMCSKLLKVHIKDTKRRKTMVEYIDEQFENLRIYYQKVLDETLKFLPVTVVFALLVFFGIYFFYSHAQSELAPNEDQGILITNMILNGNASLEQTNIVGRQVFRDFKKFPETDYVFQLNGSNGYNSGIAGMVLKPWDERTRTSMEIQPLVQKMLSQIAAAKIGIYPLPPLPGNARGFPIQFVVGTTDNFYSLNTVSQNVMNEARASGKFIYLDSDLKLDKVQANVQLNRDKSALIGLTMQDLGNVLAWSLSENYVNYFALAGRSYQVIPQVQRDYRLNPNQIPDYYIKANNTAIPLSTVASIKPIVVPESVNHFQQLNSATISAIAFPGVTMGEALDTLKNIAEKVLPSGYSVDYAGQSRQFVQESSALVITFIFALIIIFLTLAALFESFRDPLIILVSVPMSICGALIFIYLGIGGATLNIYTEVGLVTLIGLISKHGILIVQFANDLQREGKNKREAIEMAAGIRLRPILMTTASMVLGVVPLILAQGAGAVSRFNIGLVIATGIAIGTLFTIFIVPAVYLLLADDLSSEKVN